MCSKGVIEGRRDITRGRFITDRRIATPFSTEATFTSLVYNADGSLIFATGKSKWICLYDVENGVLLQKIQMSKNKALDGVLDFLNSRNLTEAGAIDLIDDEKSDETTSNILPPMIGLEEDPDLPGQSKIKKPILQTRSLSLCPTGRKFAAATTEGILIYDLDRSTEFDPIDLEEDITPQAATQFLQNHNFQKAFIVAFRLRDATLIRHCLLSTPVEKIRWIVRQIPLIHAGQMLDSISEALRNCSDLERLLHWAKSCSTEFGPKLLGTQPSAIPSLKKLQQVLMGFQSDLGSLIQSNQYLMQYIETSANR